MAAEPAGQTPLDRLLAQFPAGVPVGMLERKRLEHVLPAAGMPVGGPALVQWVEDDPGRVARVVVSVVGVSAGQRGPVREAVDDWWTQERARHVAVGERARGDGGGPRPKPWDIEIDAEDEAGRDWRAWAWVVAAIGFVVVAVVLVWLAIHEVPSSGEETTTSTGVIESDTADGSATDYAMTEGNSTGGGASMGGESSSSGGDSDPGDDNQGSESSETGLPPLDVDVRVAAAQLTDVPGWPSVPWAWLGIGLLAALGLLVLKRSPPPKGLLAAPPDREPELTEHGRVPPRGRPLRRILLDRGDRDALVWGIAREATERPTEDLDVHRSVETTIETGIPTLCFVPASEYRGVWIWRDTDLDRRHAGLATRLQGELESTLREAGLPVAVAHFDGVPTRLSMGRRRLTAALLMGVARPPRVVVLTDGDQLRRRLRAVSTQAGTEATLRMMHRWDGLAVVDFDDPRSELLRLAQDWGLRRITPDQAAAHLAGDALRQGHPVAMHDLLRWELACAVAPRSITAEEAQRLRQTLALTGVTAFDIDELRARASAVGGRGGARLDWSETARAEIFARHEQGRGYLQKWEDPTSGAGLVKRALHHWTAVYDEVLAGIGDGERSRSDTVAHHEIERAMLLLWTEPDAATRVLYRWWQHHAFEETVGDLISRHTDAQGSARQVRLPWDYGERDNDTQVSLARMGLVVSQAQTELKRGGRRTLAMGILLGVLAGAIGGAAVEATRPTVVADGAAPRGAEVECVVSTGWEGHRVDCEVSSRFPVGALSREPSWLLFGGVEVEWSVQERPCAGELVDGLRYVMCNADGEQPRQAAGWGAWSRALVLNGGGERLARMLVDSGSVDYVVVGRPDEADELLRRAHALGVMDGPGQRLVVVGDGVEVEGIDGPGVVVRVAAASRPKLDFVGTQTLQEAWPDAEVVRGHAVDFELLGTESCPSDMQLIPGGRFDEHDVPTLCMDTTEVTVGAYRRCVERGACTPPDDGVYCNWGKPDREDHPVNCVDWEQARQFCKQNGKRLPTEWEWEWAARGRELAKTYPWGEEAPSCARAVMSDGGDGCGKDRTWAVGSKPKGDSRDGVKDMAGNVWEWSSSGSGDRRLVRGGGWYDTYPDYFRADDRSFDNEPTNRYANVGFRCARTAASTQ